jgi:flagellar protein FlgJ
MAGLDSIALNAGFNTPAYVPFTERGSETGTSATFGDILEKAKKAAVAGAGKNTVSSGRIDKAVLSGEEKKLYDACQDLETFLVKNMLSGMRKTVVKSKLVDTGFAGEMYEDMLWDEYAKEYTKSADFGLAELAYLELTHQRGVKPGV